MRQDELRAPDGPKRERTMRALIALVAAIGSGELDAVTRLLADDCVLETDAAGEFHAVVVRVRGARRVAETQLAMARALILRASRIASVNGLPALVLDIVPGRKRQAPRSVLLLETGDDGCIRALRGVLATRKLAHVR